MTKVSREPLRGGCHWVASSLLEQVLGHPAVLQGALPGATTPTQAQSHSRIWRLSQKAQVRAQGSQVWASLQGPEVATQGHGPGTQGQDPPCADQAPALDQQKGRGSDVTA